MTTHTAIRWIVTLLAPALLAGCGGGQDADDDVTGTTARTAAREHPTLVAAGDIACAPGVERTPTACRQAATAELIGELDPDVVAPLGDLQYPDGALEDFRASFDESWGRYKARMRPAIGNHEYLTPDAAGYFDYFGARAGPRQRGWYSYDVGAWHVVVLNTNCDVVRCEAGSPQDRWLRDDLARNPRRCTLATAHHPRFSSGPHGPNPALAPLWRTLQGGGVDVALAGHDHSYERFAPQRSDGSLDRGTGIVQFVVGTGGAEHYPFIGRQPYSRARATDFGVLELRLGSRRYAWRFVGVPDSAFEDAGRARCR